MDDEGFLRIDSIVFSHSITIIGAVGYYQVVRDA